MNSASPVSWTSGRTSTPGWCMSTTRYEMPRCLGASGSDRARQTPQSANWAYDVHTFCPLTSHPPSTRSARVTEAGQVAPRPRLAEQLAPELLRGADLGQPAGLLFRGPVGQQRRSGQVDADPARPSRGPGPGPARLGPDSAPPVRPPARRTPRARPRPPSPPAARRPCQSRRNATSSVRSSNRGGRPWPYSHGRCSTSQARMSARNDSWSTVGVRSTESASHTSVGLRCCSWISSCPRISWLCRARRAPCSTTGPITTTSGPTSRPTGPTTTTCGGPWPTRAGWV